VTSAHPLVVFPWLPPPGVPRTHDTHGSMDTSMSMEHPSHTVSAAASLATTRNASPDQGSVVKREEAGTVNPASGRRRKYDIKYKGVYACKVSGGNYWQAQISVNGTTHHLGVFASPHEAARAYDEQARMLGRRLNFEDNTHTVAYGFPAPVSGQPAIAHAQAVFPGAPMVCGVPAAPSPAPGIAPMHIGAPSFVHVQQKPQPAPAAAAPASLGQHPHAPVPADAVTSLGAGSAFGFLSQAAAIVASTSGGGVDTRPHSTQQPAAHDAPPAPAAMPRGDPSWVGIPLGENEIQAFWRGAGSAGMHSTSTKAAPSSGDHLDGPLWQALSTMEDACESPGHCMQLDMDDSPMLFHHLA